MYSRTQMVKADLSRTLSDTEVLQLALNQAVSLTIAVAVVALTLPPLRPILHLVMEILLNQK